MVLNYAASTILKSAASLLILWPITESLYSNGNPNWNLTYIGAGCALLAIPFNKAFDKHAGQDVEYYNAGYKRTGSLNFNLSLGANGLGLVMQF